MKNDIWFSFLCFVYEKVGGLCICRQNLYFCLLLLKIVPIFNFLIVLWNISVYRYITVYRYICCIFMELYWCITFYLIGNSSGYFYNAWYLPLLLFIYWVFVCCFHRVFWGRLNMYLY